MSLIKLKNRKTEKPKYFGKCQLQNWKAEGLKNLIILGNVNEKTEKLKNQSTLDYFWEMSIRKLKNWIFPGMLYLSLSIPIYPYLSLSIYLPIYLPTYLSIYPSIHGQQSLDLSRLECLVDFGNPPNWPGDISFAREANLAPGWTSQLMARWSLFRGPPSGCQTIPSEKHIGNPHKLEDQN